MLLYEYLEKKYTWVSCMLRTDEEKQLVELLKMGDAHAVDVWYAEYRTHIELYVAQKISIKPDVDELVQQTFIHCIKQIHIFLGKSSLTTWMISIAHHEVADYYRKKYAKKALATIPLPVNILDFSIPERGETSEQVLSVLNKMKASSREILLMKYVDKKKVSVIAHELGKSIKSVESELFRARNEFRLAFAESEK